MSYTKSKIAYGIAFLGLAVLAPGLSRANDLDDAEHTLNQARLNRAQAEVNQAQAESDLRAAEANNAAREARAARNAADAAEFAKLKAEVRATEADQARRAAENSGKTVYEYSHVGSDGTHYVERKESRSSPGYVEHYEVQERTSYR